MEKIAGGELDYPHHSISYPSHETEKAIDTI